MTENDHEVRILKALENPRFRWRTIDGIAKETKIKPDIVRHFIRSKSDNVVMASAPNSKGEPLFATREQSRIKKSSLARIFSALKNRGD